MPTVASNIQTIPRNHTKQVADVFQRAVQWHRFEEFNGFRGKAVDGIYVRASLRKFRSAKLQVGTSVAGLPQATVQIHSNLWYSTELSDE